MPLSPEQIESLKQIREMRIVFSREAERFAAKAKEETIEVRALACEVVAALCREAADYGTQAIDALLDFDAITFQAKFALLRPAMRGATHGIDLLFPDEPGTVAEVDLAVAFDIQDALKHCREEAVRRAARDAMRAICLFPSGADGFHPDALPAIMAFGKAIGK
ncbi:MAG: hypothetical protein SFY80_00790 [Verrucomicrobiota bacterium]|nr:hypothetical protein [Verrucomicrobiota bacterium]